MSHDEYDIESPYYDGDPREACSTAALALEEVIVHMNISPEERSLLVKAQQALEKHLE